MCGISGFNWSDQDLIVKMNNSLVHRGPDDTGIYVDKDISLGHQRLSIIDLSAKGHQPMNFEKLSIIYNGEIYNHKEIKQELEGLGYTFSSQTDTEVILKAFHKWKEKCLEKLNGMFSFAIWDQKESSLFLARDRVGIKPLYYYNKDNKLIFASEIKAILIHQDIDKSIVPERVSFIVKMSGLPADLTIFKYIHQLPAGYYGYAKKGRLFIQKYWDVTDFKSLNDKQEIQGKIREILTDSVSRRMVSDVPVGVFLSGGIDSNIITHLASQSSSQPVKTFSIGFEIDSELDKQYNSDFYLARKTAKFFGTDHHEVFLRKGQALEYMDYLAENMEMPNSMATAVPSFWLSKAAKDHVSVVLGGDGGDELFGGYRRYQLSLILSKWFSLPAIARNLVPKNFIENILKKKNLASRLSESSKAKRYQTLKFHKNGDADKIFKSGIYRPELVDDYITTKFFGSPLPTEDFEKYFMYLDFKTWLVDHSLIRSDKVTMNFGLEQRVPILDHRLVELAAKIPTSMKLDFKDTKKIFKETFKDDLPEFLFSQPKSGWASPAAKWLRTELKDFAYDVLSDSYVSGTEEFYSLSEARKMLDDHISGKRYNLHLLWILISFQLWHKKYII